MTAKPFRSYFGIIFAAAIPAALLWSYLELRAAERGAAAAAEQVEECAQLAIAIDKLHPSGTPATETAVAATDLGQRIEEIVHDPQWVGVQLLRVDPHPPKRIPDSAYSERTTHIELRQMQLRQVILLLDALRQDGRRSQLRRLRFQAPLRNEASSDSETWSVEMMLTDRVLTPKTVAASAGKSTARR